VASGGVKVHGLKELSRALAKINKGVAKDELVVPLKEAAEVVKTDAQSLALNRISHMPGSPRWAQQRIGVSTAKGLVYMVPVAKRRGGSGRPNLKGLLLEQAMDPALERNAAKVEKKVDDLLGKLAGEAGF
jgi:hypothetical protein